MALKSSYVLVLDLINENNAATLEKPFAPGQLLFSELTELESGRDVSLRVDASPETEIEGYVTVTYDRLDLNEVFTSSPEISLPPEPLPVAGVIEVFNNVYDTEFVESDVTIPELSDGWPVEGLSSFTLTAPNARQGIFDQVIILNKII